MRHRMVGGAVAVLMAAGAALMTRAAPATRPAADVLPAGAVRRLGGRQFATDGMPYGRLAVAPDGRRAAVADRDGASVWDLATGDRTAVVRPDARPGRLAFGVAYLSADTLAVACADAAVPPRVGAVTLFLADPATGRVRGHVDLDDAGVPIDVPGGRGPGVLATTLPFDLVASPDGRRVGFRVGRQALLVYDAVTGRRASVPGTVADPAPPGPGRLARTGFPPAVSLGGGNRGVVVDGAGRATVFDAATGAPVGGRPFPANYGASVSADGRLLATVAGGAVHLFALPDGTELDAPPGPPAATRGRPMQVAFAPTGGLLAVNWYGAPPRVEVLDTAARPVRVVSDLTLRRPVPTGPVWSADGRVVALRPSSFAVMAFDARTGRLLSPPPTAADRPTAVAVDPDGRSVVIGDAAGHVHRWDLDTGRLLADLADADDAAAAVANRYVGAVVDLRYVTDADGTVALAVGRGREQWLSDRQTLAVRTRLGGPLPATGVPDVYSPDGRRVAHVDAAGAIVADAKTDRTLVAPPDDERSGRSDAWMGHVRFSDDGRLLVTWTSRGFRVLDAATGRAGPVVADGGVNTPCPSPDGRFLAVGEDQQMRLYSTAVTAGAAPQLLWTVPAANTSREPTFDDTGDWLAVPAPTADPVTNGSALTVFETATGRPVLTLPTGGLDSKVGFVPHRPLYVATEADGTALVWDLRPLLRPDGGAGRTNEQLWADLAGNDPAVAYRAGLVLTARGTLAGLSAAAGGDPPWHRLVQQLSSPDKGARESAHRQLERAGPAAAAEVRRALATHPGGETEARLADLARLVEGIAPAGPDATAADGAAIRRQRAARLVEWSGDRPAPR